jgi:hypothetical protein
MEQIKTPLPWHFEQENKPNTPLFPDPLHSLHEIAPSWQLEHKTVFFPKQDMHVVFDDL